MKKTLRKFKHAILYCFPDTLYLRWIYWRIIGKRLNLKHPQTFNEKLQWLKLYDRNPLYTTLVDKYAVKKWVADKIGEQYIIPTLGVWNSFDAIDFDTLPHQFVLKCTHDSGGIVICRDKATFDKQSARKKLTKSLKTNFYDSGREWPYKNVPPRIIAEKYMSEDDGSQELKDFKLMCFNGKVKCSFVCTERFTKDGLKVTFYDTNWNVMPFERHYPRSKTPIAKPLNYDEMVELAEKLSRDIPFVRVDFYSVKGKTYFGEMTFYPGSGFEEFTPSEWDKTLGDWVKLAGGGYLVVSSNIMLYIPISEKAGKELVDYKFLCFNGVPQFIEFHCGRFIGKHQQFYYDIACRPQPFNNIGYSRKNPPSLNKEIVEEILPLVKKLAEGIPHVRVDFYYTDRPLFGEMTFFDGSGFVPFNPPEWDKKIGDLIQLPFK